MKLLFDQNLSFRLCRSLSALYPGSSQVRLLGLETADDLTVWRHAAANGFALVSLDADFADMSAVLGPLPKVVWLRCGNQQTSTIEGLLRRHADALAAFEHDEAACLEIY